MMRLRTVVPALVRAVAVCLVLLFAVIATQCARSNDADIETLRALARTGDADACTRLGMLYVSGDGVPQDDAEAVRWFRLAAEQGDADAQHNLGFMYSTGRGVGQDNVEAVKWFRLAAEQGCADAQLALGLIYDEGRGVDQDDAEAVRWYRLAAEQGHAGARASLEADAGEPFLAPAGTVFAEVYDTAPEIIHQTPPEYPEAARTAKVQGRVVLSLGVDARGSVIEATVAQGIPELNGSALAAVRDWRFTPATRNGEPVAVQFLMPIRFALTD